VKVEDEKRKKTAPDTCSLKKSILSFASEKTKFFSKEEMIALAPVHQEE
jgi:hypothetical protein